jgi:hypothetical protein
MIIVIVIVMKRPLLTNWQVFILLNNLCFSKSTRISSVIVIVFVVTVMIAIAFVIIIVIVIAMRCWAHGDFTAEINSPYKDMVSVQCFFDGTDIFSKAESNEYEIEVL